MSDGATAATDPPPLNANGEETKKKKKKRERPPPRPESYEKCMHCGCPWEIDEDEWPDVDTTELPHSWMKHNWAKAVRDTDHEDHESAVEDLKEYIKRDLDEAIDNFFFSVEKHGGDHTGKLVHTNTLEEMINFRLYDDPDYEQFGDCGMCFDGACGNRDYRHHPDKRVRKATNCDWSGSSGDEPGF